LCIQDLNQLNTNVQSSTLKTEYTAERKVKSYQYVRHSKSKCMEYDAVVATNFDYMQHSQTPANLVQEIFHSQWFRQTQKLLTT